MGGSEKSLDAAVREAEAGATPRAEEGEGPLDGNPKIFEVKCGISGGCCAPRFSGLASGPALRHHSWD